MRLSAQQISLFVETAERDELVKLGYPQIAELARLAFRGMAMDSSPHSQDGAKRVTGQRTNRLTRHPVSAP